MRYSINLATRINLDHRLLNGIGISVIASLVVVMGWNISRVASNMGEKERLNAGINAIQSRLGIKAGGISEADYDQQKTRIRFYNEIIERKSVNWLNLLELFESVTPAGVSLTSLTPDKTKDEWKLEGSTRSFKVVQKYLENLEASKNFKNVLLLSHKNITTGEKGFGVQFSISCKVVN